MDNTALTDLLCHMLAKGRYLKLCPRPMQQMTAFPDVPVEDAPERFKLCDRNGSPVLYIDNAQLVRHKLWRVIIKDNDLAYRKKIDRYFVSRRKIQHLHGGNKIKRIYKELRASKKI